MSIGGRGATANFSRRGTTTTVGIPGTGLSFRGAPSDSARITQRQPDREEIQRRRAAALAAVNVSINSDGVLTCLDGSGVPLTGRDLSMLFEQHGDSIRTLLLEAAEKINGDQDLLGDIHRDSPHPTPDTLLERASFTVPEPLAPVRPSDPTKPVISLPREPGFLSRVVGGRKRYERELEAARAAHGTRILEWECNCAEIEDAHLASTSAWEVAREEWKAERVEHERLNDVVEARHVSRLASDRDYAAVTLEAALQELEWPRETLVSFQLDADGAGVWLDVDLPEIEDLPSREATLAANGRKLTVKQRAQKTRRVEYARHIHGVALRLATTVCATLPSVETVMLSGYSQRLNPATGVTNDDYLFSVIFTRTGLAQIDYSALDAVDPVAALTAFEHRRSMTATGVFKAIEPFSS